MIIKYMKETHSLHKEIILNGKITQKQDKLLKLDVKAIEREIFSALLGNQ